MADVGVPLVDVARPPLYVVTANDGRERSGCIVGFLTQCSIGPERYLVCLSKANHTYEVALRSDSLAVHILGEGQLGLARLFGEETGDHVDKFADLRANPGVLGAPVLEEVAWHFEGAVLQVLDLGDHSGFLLDPLTWSRGAARGVLRFGDIQLTAAHPAEEGETAPDQDEVSGQG